MIDGLLQIFPFKTLSLVQSVEQEKEGGKRSLYLPGHQNKQLLASVRKKLTFVKPDFFQMSLRIILAFNLSNFSWEGRYESSCKSVMSLPSPQPYRFLAWAGCGIIMIYGQMINCLF